ncbi:AcrR family transcriptional regulator [Streptomyces tendae]
MPAAPAYRRLSVEERRSQLLDAALGLFAHRAPEEVSLDDVAEAAGVSRPLVYRYFPGGKQQLYEAALRSAAEELRKCFDEPLDGPLVPRLARALDRYLAFVDEHDTGFSALLQGGSVVETSRTTAIVDGVRRAAAEHILRHLAVGDPGAAPAHDRPDVDHGRGGGLADLAGRGQAAARGGAAGLAGGPVRGRAVGHRHPGPADRGAGRAPAGGWLTLVP